MGEQILSRVLDVWKRTRRLLPLMARFTSLFLLAMLGVALLWEVDALEHCRLAKHGYLMQQAFASLRLALIDHESDILERLASGYDKTRVGEESAAAARLAELRNTLVSHTLSVAQAAPEEPQQTVADSTSSRDPRPRTAGSLADTLKTQQQPPPKHDPQGGTAAPRIDTAEAVTAFDILTTELQIFATLMLVGALGGMLLDLLRLFHAPSRTALPSTPAVETGKATQHADSRPASNAMALIRHWAPTALTFGALAIPATALGVYQVSTLSGSNAKAAAEAFATASTRTEGPSTRSGVPDTVLIEHNFTTLVHASSASDSLALVSLLSAIDDQGRTLDRQGAAIEVLTRRPDTLRVNLGSVFHDALPSPADAEAQLRASTNHLSRASLDDSIRVQLALQTDADRQWSKSHSAPRRFWAWLRGRK